MKQYFIFCTLLLLSSTTVNAQRNDNAAVLKESCEAIAKADIYSSKNLAKYAPVINNPPVWIKNSDYVIYRDLRDDEFIYYLVDASTGKKQTLFTSRELVRMISPITNKSHDVSDTQFYADEFIGKGMLLARVGGVDVVYDIAKKSFTKHEVKKEINKKNEREAYWKKYSSDSTYYIFGRHHDIFLAEKGQDPEKALRLTSDGVSYYSHTMYKTDKTDSANVSFRGDWFKDSNIAYGLRVDIRKVGTMMVINSTGDDKPTYSEYKFEMAGDKYVTQYEINIIDAQKREVRRAAIDKFVDQEVKLSQNFDKSTPYNSIFFTRINRLCDSLELCALNPVDGEVKVVASEVSYPKVNMLLQNYAIINGGDEIIWWSERDGKGAYFLYDKNGKQKNRITSGDFVAGRIVKIDTLKRSFIFEGFGYNRNDNPTNRSYFKVNFDGTGFKNITPGDGNHSISFSSNGNYIIDEYSAVSTPYTQIVRTINGREICRIEREVLSKLKAIGWRAPKSEKVKAADGVTDLYGVVHTPFDFDSTKKYPIICSVYPGPQTDFVPNSFSIEDDGLSALAQMGFIVIQFGYRGGSPLRGKAFYNFSVGNLRDYALADCKFVVEQLASKYKYIDVDRVGIFGHSGGGFLSAAAILTYPEFFKVAISAAGNHDNNIYAKFWGEVYNGVKSSVSKDKDGKEVTTFTSMIKTNMELAANLKGRLMLITGDIDNNVHPANTIRMADALIKNNKRFDMVIMPNMDHGLYGDYYTNLMRYYFEEHLKNPKAFNVDIVNHK